MALCAAVAERSAPAAAFAAHLLVAQPRADAAPSLMAEESGGACNDITDLETEPPSDGERPLHSTDEAAVSDLLQKMEQVNKSNDQDSRSVTTTGSRTSDEPPGGGGGGGGGAAQRASASPSSSSGNAVDAAATGGAEDDEIVDLWAVWGELVKNWPAEFRRRPAQIRELVRRGIPCHFRTIAWQLLSGADHEAVHESYSHHMRTPSAYEKVIMRDRGRTFPEHEFFKDNGRGQQSLFNVIKAYSLHDKEVGYCQGSAFIVGLLLLQMPEEEAFAVFLRIMEEYRLRELCKPAMTELGLCLFQLECLVQEQMPDLHMHFNNMGFDTSMYASSWFLTLFTTQFPLELADRIMDVFLSEGMEVVFRVAVAILQHSRFELLQLDMEGMLRHFKQEVRERYENDHDLLLTCAFRVTLNPKKMKRLEKEYLTKRTKEQEEAVELRRLRTEARLLRQRIVYLEEESAALAERLVRGQVTLAQEAENCLNINHELHKLREINADAHRRLEDAYESVRQLSSRGATELREAEVQVDDESMIEHIHTLQTELIETSSRQADNEIMIRDLKLRLHETEAANKRLRETPPDHCVATLQEELISVKMREAEANLSLKEIRQRLTELESHWAQYMSERLADTADKSGASGDAAQPAESPRKPSILERLQQRAAPSPERPNESASAKELEDQLMGLRISEADTLAELKEMRQKVMELETQNHVCTNQLRRQMDDMKRLQSEHEQALASARSAEEELRHHGNRQIETDSKNKEQSVMVRLREADLLQTIADLKSRVAELESKRTERWTTAQLMGSRYSVQSIDEPDMVPASPVFSRSHTGSDAASLGSGEDFGALVAEMSMRVPPDSPLERSALLNLDDDDDDEPQTARRASVSSGERTVGAVSDVEPSSRLANGAPLTAA